MSKIIALANQKGGVGKTTSTVNLAFCLASLGKRVLVVDSDPQGNLTSYFNFDPDELDQEGKSLYFSLVNNKPLKDIIVSSNDSERQIDLIPAGFSLAEAETELVLSGKTTILRELLNEIKNDYDYILIDCLPGLGMLFVNAMSAANSVLIPVKTDALSLSGISNLAKSISKIKISLNPTLNILGVLPTMFNKGYKHDTNHLEELMEQAESIGIKVFKPINRSTNYDKSAVEKKATIVAFPSTAGVENYLALAKYIIN